MKTLSHIEARRVYDRIGKLQDSQAFYEDRATDELIRHGEFGHAESIFEFGCGTGRFAARLLASHLPQNARYHGVDLSPTMVSLTRERIEPFGERASVDQTEGKPPNDRPAESCDRFVSNFVFDLLSEEDIHAVLGEAHRMLRPQGLVCLASLSTGATPTSRLVARLWSGIHALRPALVGGCRPVALTSYLPESHWRITHHIQIAPFALPSEAVVAERRHS
jgi:ubiquinone/menaquinone biosynthesis C-methylase UbiE